MKLVAFIFLIFALGACSHKGAVNSFGEKSIDPWQDFQNGQVRLTCGISCSSADGGRSLKYKTAYSSGDWQMLASLILEVGHGMDRNYYYLGKVAEMLGKPQAAKTYYTLAINHHFKCGGFIDICYGINVPMESNLGYRRAMAMIEDASSLNNNEAVESTSDIEPPEVAGTSIVKDQSKTPPIVASKKTDIAITPKIVPVQFEGIGDWDLSVETDPITDEKIITALLKSIDSENSLDGKTALIIRCDDGDVDIFVGFDDYLGSDSILVTSRVDKQKPVKGFWSISTNSQAAFYPKNQKKLLRELFAANQFVIRATPYNENPKTLIFDVKGIYNGLMQHEVTCRW